MAETVTLALVASLVGAVVTTLIGSLRPGVSYPDMQGLLAGRGIDVDQATVYRCRALTPQFVGGPDGDLVGGWSYLFRLVDRHGG